MVGRCGAGDRSLAGASGTGGRRGGQPSRKSSARRHGPADPGTVTMLGWQGYDDEAARAASTPPAACSTRRTSATTTRSWPACAAVRARSTSSPQCGVPARARARRCPPAARLRRHSQHRRILRRVQPAGVEHVRRQHVGCAGRVGQRTDGVSARPDREASRHRGCSSPTPSSRAGWRCGTTDSATSS